MMNASQQNSRALLAASRAPAMSPLDCFDAAIAAKMIAMMPNGVQQQIVRMIDGTR